MKSSFKNKLVYEHTKPKRNNKNKERNYIFFCSPHSKNSCGDFSNKFLDMLNLHSQMGNTYHTLYKKNTIKLPYSCLPLMTNKTKPHNLKLLSDVDNVGVNEYTKQ